MTALTVDVRPTALARWGYLSLVVLAFTTATLLVLTEAVGTFVATNGVLLVYAGLLLLIERAAPREITGRDRVDTTTDVLHLLVSSGLVPLVSAALLPIDRVLWNGGARLPLAVQLVIGVLSMDAVFYALHRGAHSTGESILWRVHAVHHSTPFVDLLAGGRRHPLHPLVLKTIAYTPLVALGLDRRALALAVLFDALVGVGSHVNVDIRQGRLNLLVPSAELHRIHHSDDMALAQNYGGCTVVWDLLFDTYRAPMDYRDGYGIPTMSVSRSYLGQLLLPLRAVWLRAQLAPTGAQE